MFSFWIPKYPLFFTKQKMKELHVIETSVGANFVSDPVRWMVFIILQIIRVKFDLYIYRG